MHEIYQIFYNESTQKSNDPGFLPLDNLSNERPDWSEYWPIRRFLQDARCRLTLTTVFCRLSFIKKPGSARRM